MEVRRLWVPVGKLQALGSDRNGSKPSCSSIHRVFQSRLATSLSLSFIMYKIGYYTSEKCEQ
jgi:hypothetical protein